MPDDCVSSFLKDGILPYKRSSFILQKVTFYELKGDLLQDGLFFFRFISIIALIVKTVFLCQVYVRSVFKASVFQTNVKLQLRLTKSR